jgi:putative peptidoglycan lipid II flippase
MVDKGDDRGTDEALRKGLGWVAAIGLPLASAFIVFREPIVRLLFEHGAFDRQSTQIVAPALVWYSLAVFVDSLCQPLWRYVYTRQRTWTVVSVNGLQTAVRLLANLALTAAFGYTGLAISALIGLSVQFCVLYWLTRTRLARRQVVWVENPG